MAYFREIEGLHQPQHLNILVAAVLLEPGFEQKATDHEIKIRRMAYSYSAAECRSRGALWPGFAPALTLLMLPKNVIIGNRALS